MSLHPSLRSTPNAPDLLSVRPRLRFPLERLQQALLFAYAGGASRQLFDEVISRVVPPESSWQPTAFARDVMLDEVVNRTFRIAVDQTPMAIDASYLVKMLAAPPMQLDEVRFRQSISRDLAENPTCRSELLALYRELRGLRDLLESPPVARGGSTVRSKLDLLRSVRAILDRMSGSFADSTSGLRRIPDYARQVCAGEGYRQLVELLDFEGGMAQVTLQLQLGYDGRIRTLIPVAIREPKGGRYHRGPFARFLTRILYRLRGYRFGEDEILARCVDNIYEGVEAHLVVLFQLSLDVQFYLASLHLLDVAAKCGLHTCLPEWCEVAQPTSVEWRGMFNPLLASLTALTTGIVPCDVTVDPGCAVTLFTGPNSGGKTRLLQSLGICQVLAQGGLIVPAAYARLTFAPGMFASIVQDVAADQPEGRLGTELLRIRGLFERVTPGGIVLIDELCSGTNPGEGEELFELVVELLTQVEPKGFISTHFLDLAARLERTPSRLRPHLAFLQVQLDTSHHPTYRFVDGVATSSLARETAARLGVTRSELQLLVEAALRVRGEPPPSP